MSRKYEENGLMGLRHATHHHKTHHARTQRWSYWPGIQSIHRPPVHLCRNAGLRFSVKAVIPSF